MCARSAELAASLKPQRLALFGYAHVPWFKTHQRLIDEARLPGLSERLEQARGRGRNACRGSATTAIGLDHFALPDDELAVAAREKRLRRNFQGYTADEADALIGLGRQRHRQAAAGLCPERARPRAAMPRGVAAGEFPIVKGLALSDDDRLRAAMIERLMCDLELDLAAFGGREPIRRRDGGACAARGRRACALDGDRRHDRRTDAPMCGSPPPPSTPVSPPGEKRHSLAV